jgi:ATP-dependent Lhr-like helicase
MSALTSSATGTLARLRGWFGERGWSPLPFQEEAWQAYLQGESGLIHAPTGVGKTLAALGGPLLDTALARSATEGPQTGLRVLWVTPLRALARDTVAAIQAPLDELEIPWRVEHRMGDTSSSRKARQRKSMPQVLVTTPESLSLLLSYPEARTLLGDTEAAVVDEWHELMGSKRGVQVELALARIRGWQPGLRTWGLSATLGNLEEARDTLLGVGAAGGRIIHGPERRLPEVATLIPDAMARFPWAGHLGLGLLPRVVELLEEPGTTLIFTNTRAQAEIWHRAIVEKRPSWTGEVALHHGSMDRKLRTAAEEGLADGSLRGVVATSTLDLGVDFGPVDRVVQIGSPKGIGRLLQRAGRSGHTPEGRSRIWCVPTNALELAEFAAAREAMARDRVEPRSPVRLALDVLVQHLVTVALGGGFDGDELLAEVRTTGAFSTLDQESWGWCLDFASRGGPALQAYPRYARIREVEGRWVGPEERKLARDHRMSVGTITDDGAMRVQFLKGKKLGTIEESFISRLRPGDTFVFAGRRLKLVRTRDMVAYVSAAKGRARGTVPRWMGGRLPVSTELGGALLALLSDGSDAPEVAALEPLLNVQARWSAIPRRETLLVERVQSREGHHLFFYPFLGRRVHDGLGALMAFRFSRLEPRTVQISANDYGFELLSPDPFPELEPIWSDLVALETVGEDVAQSVNQAEMGRRHFREVARISGLVHTGYPGRSKTARQLQASSGLVHDVLERYDPDNLLLDQTRREVLEREIQVRGLEDGLGRIRGWARLETTPERLTPLAFPIWAERIQAQVTSESWKDRVARMVVKLETAAGLSAGGEGGA